MVTLYRFEIDINTGEIERHIDNDPGPTYEWNTEEVNYATYNEDGFENVYAESLISVEHAEDLAFEKCKELRDKFSKCVDNILYGGIQF